MSGPCRMCKAKVKVTQRNLDGGKFESVVKFVGGFKVRNSQERKMLKSLVEVVKESGGFMGGWFSKKEEKPKDKNEIKINIIQRKDKFPKVLMREGR